MKKLSLMEVLEGIEDTRRERSVWYPLQEVLFIMLTAVICGATSYKKVDGIEISRNGFDHLLWYYHKGRM